MCLFPTKYALTLFPFINFVFICYLFKDEIMSYDFNKLIKNEIKQTHNFTLFRWNKYFKFSKWNKSYTFDTYWLIYWTFASASILQATANLIIYYSLHLQAPNISFAYGYVAAPIMSVIFSSINEEVIYRKIIFGGLNKKYNFWISSIVSSLFFMVCHYNYSAWLGYLTVGLIWSYTYKKTGNLGINIVAHVGMNLAYFVFYTIK